MKWAKVKEQSLVTNSKKEQTEQSKKNDDICFDEYPDVKTLENEMVHDSKKWIDHKFEYNFPEPAIENYEAFQKRYETFCGGYLFYYDDIVRNRVVDHTIYFKWSPEKGKGKYSVTIYLSPAPQRANGNYIKKSGKGTDTNHNEKLLLQQDFSVAVGGVDPPPPPPPPPPPMH